MRTRKQFVALLLVLGAVRAAARGPMDEARQAAQGVGFGAAFPAALFAIPTPPASPAAPFAGGALVQRLSAAGFQCAAAVDGSGRPFGGVLCTHAAVKEAGFALDQPVGIFIPSAGAGAVSRIVLYLQGFRGVCGDAGASPGDVMNVFKLGQQMQSDAAAGSVLVFPVSVGRDATYYADFAAKAGPFAAFMGWVEGAVGASPRWSLAGHSGAGDVIARTLDLNPSTVAKFDAIELLDAAYGLSSAAELAFWRGIARRNPGLAVACVGNGTYAGCRRLADGAGFRTPVVVTQTSVAHCAIPGAYFGPWLKEGGR